MATQLRELTDEVQSKEYSCIEESDLAELRERIRVEPVILFEADIGPVGFVVARSLEYEIASDPENLPGISRRSASARTSAGSPSADADSEP